MTREVYRWFDSLTSRWPLVDLKFGFNRIGSGTTPPSEGEEYYGDGYPWVTTSELRENVIVETKQNITEAALEKFSALKLYEPGTLLFAMYGATIGRLGILGIEATVNQAVCALAHPTRFVPKFALYGLQASREYLVAISGGGGQPNLNAEQVRNHALPCPTIEQQSEIVQFLERETVRIDELVEAKESMLQLLEQKRAALISRAVTCGLDSNVATKASDLDWLGEIPEHWQIERGKNLFSVRDERSEDGEEELLTVSHITGVTSRAEKEVYMFKSDDMTGYKRCMKDDFATNTLWAWMGAMGISPLDGIVSPDYHVYTSKGQILPEFMELLCRSRPFVAEVIRWSKGVWSSRLRLYPENFFEIRFPIPPKSEQEEIVAEIAAFKEKTTKLADALVESIKLLKERRSALITAAVTGRIPLQEMTE